MPRIEKLLTRDNINNYLVDCLGIDPEELTTMPDYVKRELVEDDVDFFLDFITEEV